MRIKHFNIHNFIRMKWSNPLWSIVPGFACKYNYFEIPQGEYDTLDELSDITTLVIHSRKPPASLLKTIVPSAERFGVGDDIMEIRHQHGKMRWTSWVAGLDTDNPEIWYDFPIMNRLQWPWMMFPDHIICFHVIQPIIEYKLAQKNIAFVHAGAVAKNNKAVLLAGRGGVKKTSYMMQLIKNGWEYLADDLVILFEKNLYSYPLCDTFFDYYVTHHSDEKVNIKSMIGALRHVRKDRPISFPVAKASPVIAVNLLIAWSEDQNRLEAEKTVDDDILDKIQSSDRLERLNFVDFEEAMGRFMLQLNQVYGSDDWNKYWIHHRELLETNLSDLPCREILTCQNIDTNLLIGLS